MSLVPKVKRSKKKEITTLSRKKPNTIQVSYGVYDSKEDLISTDAIIDRWALDRSLFILSLRPENFNSPWDKVFPIDRDCRYSLGENPIHPQQCFGCFLLRRFFPRATPCLDQPFSVLAGKYTDTVHKITLSEQKLNGFYLTRLPNLRCNSLLHFLSQLCHPDLLQIVERTQFWGTRNGVGLYATVSSILDLKLRSHQMPGVPPFQWLYQCGEKICLLDREFSLGKGSLDPISNQLFHISNEMSEKTLTCSVVRGILFQLISMLHLTTHYQFIHGEACLDYLGFSRHPASYEYEGVVISSPITLHLIPSEFSSISLTHKDDPTIYRIFNSRSLPRFQLPISGIYRYPNEYGFRIGEDNLASFLEDIRHAGVPLFSGSLDLYLFFIALMQDRAFANCVLSDRFLFSLWSSLWDPSEYCSVMEEIEQSDRSFDSNMTLISRYILRCNALSSSWKKIRESLN